MAKFDASATVNNILLGGGDTALEHVGKLIDSATALVALPAEELGKLGKLPGLVDVLGSGSVVGDALGGLFGGASKRQPPEPKPVQRSEFNPFSAAHTSQAVAMASKLMEIANKKGGDAGLDDAIAALGSLGEMVGGASGLVGNLVGDHTGHVSDLVKAVGVDALGLTGLRQQVLALFITHYPPARQKFKMPSFEQRQPGLYRSAGGGSTPPEDRMDFWREDIQLNDHHGKWHLVNPVRGRPTGVPGAPPDMGDRHGELFAYMHEQMLARYDAERLGVALPRVKPFDDYRAPIPEGYDPGDLMEWNDGVWVSFTKRPANVTIRDFGPPMDPNNRADADNLNSPGAKIADMERFRDALLEAARRGWYEVGDKRIDMTSDNFGSTVEATTESVDYTVKDNYVDPANFANYGDLHNIGHLHFSYFENIVGPPAGVLSDLDVTSRDPIFWRWHKHVDDIIQTWRETLGKREPHDFSAAPPVTVRSEDIILCGEGGLPGKEGLPAGFEDRQLGAAAFGYSADSSLNQWDNDFSSGPTTFEVILEKGKNGAKDKTVQKKITTTAELTTEMRTRTIQIQNPGNEQAVPQEIKYLSHEDFFYFIRLQNRSERAQQVTVRIFLAPEPWVDENTAWIEMDRFLHRLAGGERAVVFRPARLSAVIRKPAIGHAELESAEPLPSSTNWCDCGWPYTLLLPRSTKEGLDFRLLVMLSSDDLTMTDTGEICTSMSYCGVQDKDYPDKRPMGYPFDRSLSDGIDSIIGKHENWASRKIRIRCRNS